MTLEQSNPSWLAGFCEENDDRVVPCEFSVANARKLKGVRV